MGISKADCIGNGTQDHCLDFYRALHKSTFNFKELVVLITVFRCGSCSAAADFLNVSQPSISYAMAKLESEIGFRLFTSKGRQMKPTAITRMLLEQVEVVLAETNKLKILATTLRDQWCPNITLIVDETFPPSVLFSALRSFESPQQSAPVQLLDGTYSQIEKALQDQGVDLAIHRTVPAGLKGDLLAEIEHVPVARPEHPLFKLGRALTKSDMKQQRLVVARSEAFYQRETCGQGEDSLPYWEVTDSHVAERAIREGLGYGWLPRAQVRISLEIGALKILPVQDNHCYCARYYLIRLRPLLTLEAKRLASILLRTAAQDCA